MNIFIKRLSPAQAPRGSAMDNLKQSPYKRKLRQSSPSPSAPKFPSLSQESSMSLMSRPHNQNMSNKRGAKSEREAKSRDEEREKWNCPETQSSIFEKPPYVNHDRLCTLPRNHSVRCNADHLAQDMSITLFDEEAVPESVPEDSHERFRRNSKFMAMAHELRNRDARILNQNITSDEMLLSAWAAGVPSGQHHGLSAPTPKMPGPSLKAYNMPRIKQQLKDEPSRVSSASPKKYSEGAALDPLKHSALVTAWSVDINKRRAVAVYGDVYATPVSRAPRSKVPSKTWSHAVVLDSVQDALA